MGISPFTDSSSDGTSFVDQSVGEAYTVVKHVHENLEYIKHVSANLAEIYRVAGSIDAVDSISTEITKIDTMLANMDDIVSVADNMAQVQQIVTNISAILDIHGSLPELLDIQANLAAFLAEVDTITGFEGRVSALETNSSTINDRVTVVENDKLDADKVIDEDDMTSNSDARVPTQQSVKAYTDAIKGELLTTIASAYPATMEALKALNPSLISSAYLTEDAKDGYFFSVDYSAFSSLVDADTAEGVFSRSSVDDTKVWMRASRGPLNALWFTGNTPLQDWDAFDGGDTRGANRLAAGSVVYTGIAGLKTLAFLLRNDMYFPAGRYEISGQRNMPFRQEIVSELLDCGGISILTDGPSTIFATNSENGADVFQLNGMDNFAIRGYPTVTAIIGDGDVAGSNGVSITNGFDRLHIEITAHNLPSLDKTTYGDGGKGLTIQPANTTMKCGSLYGRVRAKGCLYGFGADLVLETVNVNSMAIDVNVIAEDCYIACSIGCPSATEGLSPGISFGMNITGISINCQKDVLLSRVYDVDVDMRIATTKTAAQRRLSPVGSTWITSDTIVEAFVLQSVANSRVTLVGDKQDCDYTGRIYAASADAGGLDDAGELYENDIYIDIDGTPSFNYVTSYGAGSDFGRNCRIYVSNRTQASSLDAAFYAPAKKNEITHGPAKSLANLTVAGSIWLAGGTDGTVPTGQIGQLGNITFLRGKSTSTAGELIAGLMDDSGGVRLGIRNGNGIVVDSLASATPPPGAANGAIFLYDTAGNFIAEIETKTPR